MHQSSQSTSPTFRRGIFQALLVAAIMFSSLGGYLFILKWRGSAATTITWLPADEWLPFWPSWAVVYLFPYLIGPILIGLLSPPTFWWYIRSGLVLVGLTLAIFVLFPTQIDVRHRSEDVGTAFAAEVYRHVIEVDDPPANAAPSLHVSLTCLLLLALLRDYPRAWPLWIIAVGLVWLSTLVTRQHHFIDVATAILLTLAVAYLPRAWQG